MSPKIILTELHNQELGSGRVDQRASTRWTFQPSHIYKHLNPLTSAARHQLSLLGSTGDGALLDGKRGGRFSPGRDTSGRFHPSSRTGCHTPNTRIHWQIHAPPWKRQRQRFHFGLASPPETKEAQAALRDPVKLKP